MNYGFNHEEGLCESSVLSNVEDNRRCDVVCFFAQIR
jgi:hypothetical protein